MTRSEKAKDIWYQKALAKIKPEVLERIQRHAAAEAVDAYEAKHLLGKYTPAIAEAQISRDSYVAPVFPKFGVIYDQANILNRTLNRGIHTTAKEGVRQDLELAVHHLNIVLRYASKATNQ